MEGDASRSDLLWWVLPGELAGMPMPYLHPERRMNGTGELDSFEDDLSSLWTAGVRAVVSLLNLQSDKCVYESAGFDFLCLPVPDGAAPSDEQARQFVDFVRDRIAEELPVAVHCQAGIGRTGTMLGVFLIALGRTPQQAIDEVRISEPAGIETPVQVDFLFRFGDEVG